MVLVKPAYEFDPGHRFGTTDCDLLQKSTRGRSFFFSASCPLGLIRRHNDGSTLLTMLRTRRTQIHNHGLCAHSGWGQQTRRLCAHRLHPLAQGARELGTEKTLGTILEFPKCELPSIQKRA